MWAYKKGFKNLAFLNELCVTNQQEEEAKKSNFFLLVSLQFAIGGGIHFEWSSLFEPGLTLKVVEIVWGSSFSPVQLFTHMLCTKLFSLIFALPLVEKHFGYDNSKKQKVRDLKQSLITISVQFLLLRLIIFSRRRGQKAVCVATITTACHHHHHHYLFGIWEWPKEINKATTYPRASYMLPLVIKLGSTKVN